MSNLGNHTFRHHCQSCGKELSPILADLKMVRFENRVYDICEECYQIGCKNGVIDNTKEKEQ